jgi:hypothetical protein
LLVVVELRKQTGQILHFQQLHQLAVVEAQLVPLLVWLAVLVAVQRVMVQVVLEQLDKGLEAVIRLQALPELVVVALLHKALI